MAETTTNASPIAATNSSVENSSAADSADVILSRLSRSRRVLITTHVRPDGDALGTCVAMSLGLRHKGIENEVLLLSALPEKYAFIFKDNKIVHHDVDGGFPRDYSLARFDTLLVVDTGTWSQLPGLRERLNGWGGQKLVVDHHLTQEDWADTALVQTDAAAAGEIAADLLERWNVRIDQPIATALFLALVSDTGWFHYNNTRPRTLRLAAALMEAGVDTDLMYQLLYQNEPAQRLSLQTRGQVSMELLSENRLSVMMLRREDFQATGAAMSDTENLINLPLQVRSVEVSILFIEPGDGGPIRVSLRSKGAVDVARFAEQFGGGGHARAAGLKIPGPLAEARDRVVSEMIKQLER
jgi:phosphoesterase RecJ-like protein